ncbi:MAG: HAD-IC family P-type ATPase [Candidatus Thiodiazotropha sp. (ex Myrtea spinifera)]|nr:HAD-IC family P-type ATPase [Candidatus Thiodiazotropha sp. (ex Myrtea spinifera)]
MADEQRPTSSKAPYALDKASTLSAFSTSIHGLSEDEAASRLKTQGPNTLPKTKPPGVASVFLNQFLSPLIYVLLAAAAISVAIGELSDAAFISGVLLINAVIGTIQEFSAQQAAAALSQLVSTRCDVLRGGESYEVDAEELVPGDIVLLASGSRIPADIRLLESLDLEIDESLLTGESIAVLKDSGQTLEDETVLGDRCNMGFAGTLVNRGRGQGVVTATALSTELGAIAAAVLTRPPAKAPLLVRMEQFTQRVAVIVGIAALLMAAVALSQGMPLEEIFFLAVALAVSVIPEGLPVALTVALAVGMRRMVKRHVIIRRLVAVEGLGSCTFIATDKTGTLTVNQLTAKQLLFPHGEQLQITGEGMKPDGKILNGSGEPAPHLNDMIESLSQTAVLANEGFLGRRDHAWAHHGDAVDVALLVLAHKAGVIKAETEISYPPTKSIPYESEQSFSANLNRVDDNQQAFVKGALEQLLPMCDRISTPSGPQPLLIEQATQQAQALAEQGYRVLAFARGDVQLSENEVFSREHLTGLTLIGLVGMIDPLRPEAKAAVADCHKAGIEVAMVTGDHPATAAAIARELELIERPQQVVTGNQLKQAETAEAIDGITRDARVYARVEPQQKLEIVQSLQRNGHFVAVSGDGANDAPALRAAQVGVAMGECGTDVARETAELIITDDNFASIVAGVEEGRIAYANVRKVIFLLISTGAAELVLFTLALLTGLPLPLLAVQLLWLNLVTNGIQDVALAFEPGEGHELKHPPRDPKESIFNRIMIERVVVSALIIGIAAFIIFQMLISQGYTVDEARNGTLLLMVLFENIHVFNCRSETRSAFTHNPLRNPILLFGTLAAQLIHIGAMYTPWISDVLGIQPVSPWNWFQLLLVALSVLIAMELQKIYHRRLSDKQ